MSAEKVYGMMPFKEDVVYCSITVEGRYQYKVTGLNRSDLLRFGKKAKLNKEDFHEPDGMPYYLVDSDSTKGRIKSNGAIKVSEKYFDTYLYVNYGSHELTQAKMKTLKGAIEGNIKRLRELEQQAEDLKKRINDEIN